MSDWTEVSDIRKQLERKWNKGDLLVARLRKEPLSLRIPLKKPATKDWVDRYDETRAWLNGLAIAEKKHLFEIARQSISHRQLGENKFPQAVVFASDESLFKFIGRLADVHRFGSLCEEILGAFPQLGAWLEKRALVALENSESWPKLLAVLSFLQKNPRPGIYVRQLEIPEIDTKFIEKHKKILSELLDVVLPAETIDWDAAGGKHFEQRYGFTPEPIPVRFRILDEEQYISGLSDIQIPKEEFEKLYLDIDTVFITENKINVLAFPPVKRAIVIFGKGFGLDRLSKIGWLHSKDIHYWGDIDTHGFAILDQLRSYFPKAKSFLMDKDTLMRHRSQWGYEGEPTTRALQRLLPEEQEVYQALINDTYEKNLRLEQEKISFKHLKRYLQKFDE